MSADVIEMRPAKPVDEAALARCWLDLSDLGNAKRLAALCNGELL